MAGTGFELPPEDTGKTRVPAESGAECGALGALSAPFDPDLAVVIEAWPMLPETVKAKVVAMVQAAGLEG